MRGYNIFWIAFAIGGALLISIFTYSLSLPSNEDSILYLLSSISQGLAAIFTLVFAITIFGAQMMRKFTAMDKMIDKWTICLMIVFAIGIIFPLTQLRTDDNLLNINFIDMAKFNLSASLGITVLCVLSLIPYLIRVNHIMKYDGGILKLTEEASEAIDLDHEVSTSNKISELGELGKSAVDEVLVNEASIIVEKIGNLHWNVIDKRFEVATMAICRELREIGLNASNKSEISLIPVVEKTIKILDMIANKGIDGEMSEDVFSESLGSLIDIGDELLIGMELDSNPLKSIVKKRDKSVYANVILLVVENSIELSNKAHNKYEIDTALGLLWVLGAHVIKYMPEYAEEMIGQIKKSDIHNHFGDHSVRENAHYFSKDDKAFDELIAFEKMFDKT